MNDHIQKMKLAMSLGYPPEDIIRICAEGNLAMWEDYVRLTDNFIDNQRKQIASMDAVLKAISKL